MARRGQHRDAAEAHLGPVLACVPGVVTVTGAAPRTPVTSCLQRGSGRTTGLKSQTANSQGLPVEAGAQGQSRARATGTEEAPLLRQCSLSFSPIWGHTSQCSVLMPGRCSAASGSRVGGGVWKGAEAGGLCSHLLPKSARGQHPRALKPGHMGPQEPGFKPSFLRSLQTNPAPQTPRVHRANSSIWAQERKGGDAVVTEATG